MSFDISGTSTVSVTNGYASVHIDRVDYDSDIYSRSGTMKFTLWATTAPYYGGTISGYRLVDYTPANNSTLQDNWYLSNVNFGGQVNVSGKYYLTVTVSEYIGGTYYLQDSSSFTKLFTLGSGGGGGGGGGAIPGLPIGGTDGPDRLEGTNSAEQIFGYAGNDFVLGYAGNDTIYGGAGRDSVSAGYGADIIYGGSGNDLLSGQDGNDKVYGGTGNDNIGGNTGHDYLSGGAGRDFLFGDHGGTGAGRDTLIGGRGQDVLYGGRGADRFVFQSVDDAKVFGSVRTDVASTLREEIADFSHRDGDLIVLRAIDANTRVGGDQAFSFIGGAAFSGRAGQLRFANEMLMGDVNGDRRADFVIEVTDVARLTRGDFIL